MSGIKHCEIVDMHLHGELEASLDRAARMTWHSMGKGLSVKIPTSRLKWAVQIHGRINDTSSFT